MRRIKAALLRTLPESMLQMLRKRHYARVLGRFEPSEEPDLVLASRLIAHGDRAIDLGANIGVYTFFLSRAIGEKGLVCAVEPVPPTHEILAYNVKSLGLRNVRLVRCAVSSAEGIVTMQIPRFEWGGENLYQSRIVGSEQSEGLRRFSVTARTIDSLYQEMGPPVTFIKCDVEGHELACLQGARKVLENEKPAWLIEVSGNPDSAASEAHDLFELLRESGYRAFTWRGSRLVPRRKGDRWVNYFFLTPAQIVGLRERGVAVDSE
jgi:FkbM family methyltransferase